MRARFQFRLRTLMIAVTLLALIPCGYVGWRAKIVRERKLMLDKVVSLGGGYAALVNGRSIGNGPSQIDRLLGDEPIVEISFSKSNVGDRFAGLRAAFPEASIDDLDDPIWSKYRPDDILPRGRHEIR